MIVTIVTIVPLFLVAKKLFLFLKSYKEKKAIIEKNKTGKFTQGT